MTPITIGIDCGKDGFVTCAGAGVLPRSYETPVLPKGKSGHEYDDGAMADLLRQLNRPPVALCVLEKQQAMPGQGVTSMFSVGLGFGLWRGIVAGLAIPVLVVHPRTWQAVLLRDIPGDDTKSRSIIAAKRLYPTLDLRRTERCRTPDHNKADSILLARYGELWLGRQDSPAAPVEIEHHAAT